MRVGVNATFLSSRPTGIGVYTTELCKSLGGLAESLTVFSPFEIPGVPPESLSRVPTSIKGSLSFWGNLYRFVYLNSRLPLRCRAKGIDVLFCPMMEYPFLATTPAVVHVHDLHPLQYGKQFGRAQAHFRLSLALLSRLVRRVVVSSGFVKSELLRVTSLSPEKIEVVPLSYDHSLFVPARSGTRQEFCERYGLRQPYILFVGNLFRYKNVLTLIQAFLEILDRIPHVLVIVGRRDLSKDPLPLHERIYYMDYVPKDDLPKFYSFADLHVHPSLSEGFGITPLEAMACGAPVISSNAASLPEVVGDAALLFDPHDTGELSRLILRVLNDEPLRCDLRERGFRRAQRFSWERTAWGVLDACRKALEMTA